MSYDVDEMNSIGGEIKEHGIYNISVEDVIESVQRLKLGKSKGEEDLNSDHVIHGPRILYVLLTLVFNCMLVHGYSRNFMSVVTIVLIPKDKRQLACTSDNFIVVTLSSIVAKLFDVIILSKEQYALTTSHLQLGFKQNMSTILCTYVMMETISHYNAGGSDVYALMLDANKTFDRANYGKPFRVLLKR